MNKTLGFDVVFVLTNVDPIVVIKEILYSIGKSPGIAAFHEILAVLPVI